MQDLEIFIVRQSPSNTVFHKRVDRFCTFAYSQKEAIFINTAADNNAEYRTSEYQKSNYTDAQGKH